jgi:DNA-3-methyladenine glycosylase II
LRKIVPDYWQTACEYLSAKDKTMAGIIREHQSDVLFSFGDPFKTLTNAIVGQQISVKAAESVWLRLIQALPNEKIHATAIAHANENLLREVGLSRQKILYLKNIAEYFLENNINHQYFLKRSVHEVSAELLAIKGIGTWTLEMFQIFYQCLPDVFPIGDIGLIKAVLNNYPKVKNDKTAILKFAERWAPYKTVAVWYLWRTFDDEPVRY